MRQATAKKRLALLLARAMKREARELEKARPRLSNPKLARKLKRALLRMKRCEDTP